MRRRLSIVMAAAALSFALVPGSARSRSAGMVSVTNWDSNCCASCANVPERNNMITRWYNNIKHSKHGAQAYDDYNIYRIDSTISQDLLTDTPEPGHNDDEWIDGVNVAIVGMHGGEHPSHFWRGQPRITGVYGECSVEATEMKVGDLYNNSLVLSSCHSACKEYFPYWSNWDVQFNGTHQIDGFHGVMWIDEDLRDNYAMLSDDGFDMPVKLSFIDNLYKADDWYVDGVSVDQCPIPVSAGASSSQAEFHRDNYDYYSWDSDPTGSIFWARSGIVGCDPNDDWPY